MIEDADGEGEGEVSMRMELTAKEKSLYNKDETFQIRKVGVKKVYSSHSLHH